MPTDTFFNLPADKRETIIDLAIDEFADNDYQNASISRLVERAGIAKGSFYQYFDNKKDLYLYLLALADEEQLRVLDALEPPETATTLFEYLRWLVTAQAEYRIRRPRLADLAYRAYYSDLPFEDMDVEQVQSQARDYFRDKVRQAAADGTIDPRIDLDLATWMFATLFTEIGNYVIQRLDVDARDVVSPSLSTEKTEQMHRIFENLIYILEHGMGRAQ